MDHPNEIATPDHIIVYRRPLISANILPGTPIMWDGREPSLETQASAATVAPGHAQGNVPLTTQQRAEMAAFQLNLFVAQVIGSGGTGDLRRAGGGPEALAATPFVLDQNANKLPVPPRLTQDVFTLYGDWADSGSPKRQRVFRGREIFNKRPIGPVPLQATGFTTCSSCHSALDNSGGNDLAATPAPPNLGGNFTNTNVSGGGVAGVLVAPPDIAPFLHHGPAEVHVPPQADGPARDRDRPRPWPHQRDLGGHRPIQDPDAAWSRRAGAVLPQRFGGDASRRAQALQHGLHEPRLVLPGRPAAGAACLPRLAGSAAHRGRDG